MHSYAYVIGSHMLSNRVSVFFFQAEDGIRDLVRSRGLGDVYKRQALDTYDIAGACDSFRTFCEALTNWYVRRSRARFLSLIHI